MKVSNNMTLVYTLLLTTIFQVTTILYSIIYAVTKCMHYSQFHIPVYSFRIDCNTSYTGVAQYQCYGH